MLPDDPFAGFGYLMTKYGFPLPSVDSSLKPFEPLIVIFQALTSSGGP